MKQIQTQTRTRTRTRTGFLGIGVPTPVAIVVAIVVVSVFSGLPAPQSHQVTQPQSMGIFSEPTLGTTSGMVEPTDVSLSELPPSSFSPLDDYSVMVSAEVALQRLPILINEVPSLFQGIQLPEGVDGEIAEHQNLLTQAFLAGDEEGIYREGGWFQQAATENPQVEAARQALVQGFDFAVRSHGLVPEATPWIANSINILWALGEHEVGDLLFNDTLVNFQEAEAAAEEQARAEAAAEEQARAEAAANPEPQPQEQPAEFEDQPLVETLEETPAEFAHVVEDPEIAFLITDAPSMGLAWSPPVILWSLRDLYDWATGNSNENEVWYVIATEERDTNDFGIEWIPTYPVYYIYFSQDPMTTPELGTIFCNGEDDMGRTWFKVLVIWEGGAPFQVGDHMEGTTLVDLFRN